MIGDTATASKHEHETIATTRVCKRKKKRKDKGDPGEIDGYQGM